jgi:hypothetical protein
VNFVTFVIRGIQKRLVFFKEEGKKFRGIAIFSQFDRDPKN